MPSRKRNKGRARKAKAKAAGGAPRSRFGCRHGCTLPRDHVCICSAFVETCYGEWGKAAVSSHSMGTYVGVAMLDGMSLALKKYPIDKSDWDQAKSRFVEDGVNTILRGDFNPATIGMIAAAILHLESENSDLILAAILEKEGLKLTDIMVGCKRTAIQFFSKRISCSCLDDLYAEAKETLTKIGRCWNCGQVKEHIALMECSACKSVQYCSKECQVAHWPSHKEHCDAMRKYEKEQK